MTERFQATSSRGLALIEEWPEEDTSAIIPHTALTQIKRVRFAEYSKRRIYITSPDYEYGKSYSSADQKIFRKEATREGTRIRNLVSSCALRTGSAVHLLLSKGLLSREELLGLESLLTANPTQESDDRRAYTDLVLATQKKMRERNENTVDDEMLAKVAAAGSSRRIEKARLRAKLAS